MCFHWTTFDVFLLFLRDQKGAGPSFLGDQISWGPKKSGAQMSLGTISIIAYVTTPNPSFTYSWFIKLSTLSFKLKLKILSGFLVWIGDFFAAENISSKCPKPNTYSCWNLLYFYFWRKLYYFYSCSPKFKLGLQAYYSK